ncbi:ADP-ribosylglycohydrolase family protein [Streptomyces armeniacus]|uniref:ADP-ribosylglycohydrolase family protein n=1 Tax=Streptomyces armeniacus TaxID=83291 RepID=A0A345XWJ6_9ACTN|nr:ADP-ribosylglycohydrolase family protein [Streptomyces armeniacus]AXK36012.1 ADP-ribosylglycohydrolase family protein [Streptomyces armeniacus]
MSGALRLTWVQPEDLVGHELRQAAEDGRDAAAIQRRWIAAGGALAPERAGASPGPTDPRLRALAQDVLDELAELPSPSAAYEPTDLAAIKAACPQWPTAAPTARTARTATHQPSGAAHTTRLEAAWLGRAVGCVLGKPVEKLPLTGIREIARATGNWPLHTWFTARGLPADTAARWPWNRRSAATSLAENIDGAPEDDDLNYPLLALLLLQRHGHTFRTADVAQLWLDELPAGRTFTAERVAYRNLLDGIEPPLTASTRNPFREWIGAQIRADVFGWTHPGDPATAAELAWRDAVLTHTANGVYGAMFVAAVTAAAAGAASGAPGAPAAPDKPAAPRVHECLRAGLAVVPERSRYAAAVRTGIEAALAEPTGTAAGFEPVADALHAAYGRHHWVHVLPNAALLSAALTHADGDFTGSVSRAVSGGWDTDSNGATAGSVAGLLAGAPDALPARWTAPLRNRLATTVGGLDGIGFDELAVRTAALAAPPAPPAPPGATAPRACAPGTTPPGTAPENATSRTDRQENPSP